MALVTCQDCGREMSDKAASCPQCGRPRTGHPPAMTVDKTPMATAAAVAPVVPGSRKVSGRLFVAIALLPGLFCWFTLRKGYSAKARGWAFAYTFVGGFLFLATLAGIGEQRRASTPAYASSSTPQVIAEHTADAPPQYEQTISVTATELFDAYEQNEIAADERFKGKLVRVSGVIGSIGKDVLDKPYVSLQTSGLFHVQCMLDSDVQASHLRRGSRISMRGRVTGKMMNVLLSDCVL